MAVCNLFVVGCASVPPVAPPPLPPSSIQVKGEISLHQDAIMIVIKDPRGDARKFGGGSPLYSAHINYDNDPLLQRVSKNILRDYKLISQDQWPIKSLGVHCIVVNMPNTQTLRKLRQDARVAWVQHFNTFETQFLPSPLLTSSLLVKHDSMQDQRSLRPKVVKTISPDITLPNFGQGVKIMVIDTGVSIRHPDFRRSTVRYKNFVHDKSNAAQETHGTAVTGLLAANNASAPVKGLTHAASLYHYRGCWQNNMGAGKCSTLTLALALDAAVAVRPDVINLSLSGPPDRILEALLNKLIHQGAIIVSAHDVQREVSARFPRAQSGVIYAYGLADNQHHNDYRLPDNTFLASSTALSLAPNGAYDIYTGHSIAAPQVTATVATLIAKDPSISSETVAKRLEQWLTVP